MGRRRCCCVQECFLFTDDFNRSDSIDLGANWNEVSGQWSIGSLQLSEIGTPGARVICTRALPTRSGGEAAVQITVIGAEEGDVYKILLFLEDEDDTGTGIPVSFTKLDSNNPGLWEVAIYGGTSIEMEATPYGGEDTHVRLNVCADRETSMIKAFVTSLDEFAWADDVVIPDELYIGIQHENSHEVTFDDYYMTEMRTPEEVCNDCWCWCETHAVKKSLVATIFNAVDRAACLEGLEWEMNWEWNGGTERWYGIAEFPSISLGTSNVEFGMYCGNQGVKTTFLWNFLSGSCCDANEDGCAHDWYATDASSCSPLMLVFGPFLMSASDLNCDACYSPLDEPPASGSFYIVVTEAA